MTRRLLPLLAAAAFVCLAAACGRPIMLPSVSWLEDEPDPKERSYSTESVAIAPSDWLEPTREPDPLARSTQRCGGKPGADHDLPAARRVFDGTESRDELAQLLGGLRTSFAGMAGAAPGPRRRLSYEGTSLRCNGPFRFNRGDLRVRLGHEEPETIIGQPVHACMVSQGRTPLFRVDLGMFQWRVTEPRVTPFHHFEGRLQRSYRRTAGGLTLTSSALPMVSQVDITSQANRHQTRVTQFCGDDPYRFELVEEKQAGGVTLERIQLHRCPTDACLEPALLECLQRSLGGDSSGWSDCD